MAASDDNKTCVKCQKAVKSTEIVLVCGLWCRNSFHNYCVGLSYSEANAVTYSKERIKFHCEACEKRLGIDVFGEREIHDHNKLENYVNNRLLELVQNLLRLTNGLSNDNLVINTKLDTVLSSNAKLEEYLLQSPKRFEKQSEETAVHSLEYVESESAKRTTEIHEQNNTNSQNQGVNSECCGMELQQTEDNSSLHIANYFPNQMTDSQQQNIPERCSSNHLQKWEVSDGYGSTWAPRSIDKDHMQGWEAPGNHSGTQDPLSIHQEGFSTSEDFLTSSTLTVQKAEDKEDEEQAASVDNREECPPSEGFIGPSTFDIERTENEEDEEAVREDDFEDHGHEVVSISSDSEPESTVPVGVEDKSNDDSSGFATNVSLGAGTGNRIQCTTNQEASCWNEIGERYLHSCSVYHKTFTMSGALKRHFRIHTGERPYICGICKKTFTYSSTLKQHLPLHSAERPYACDVCNKTFTRRTKLKDHLKLHTGEHRYNCAVCKKTFALLEELKEHTRVDGHELPHCCSICNKSFTSSSLLKRHFRVHTGERPYKCDICNKTFSQRCNLKQHLYVHTGERPYSCGVCTKSFLRNTQLQQHLQLHIDDQS